MATHFSIAIQIRVKGSQEEKLHIAKGDCPDQVHSYQMVLGKSDGRLESVSSDAIHSKLS
jgi:hypothetical protein